MIVIIVKHKGEQYNSSVFIKNEYYKNIKDLLRIMDTMNNISKYF